MQRSTDRRGDRWWAAVGWVLPIAVMLLVVGGPQASVQAQEPRQVTCDPLLPDTVRPGDLFACALDAAPGLLVIGSVRDDLRAEDAGTVYVFDGGAPPLRLAPDNLGPTDRFGYAVDVDRGGGRFAVSTPFHDGAGRDAGGAWVYARGELGWGIEAQLTVGAFGGGLRPVDQFGYAVALDGPWAAVGAPGDDRGGDAAGAVYLFRRSAFEGQGGWEPAARLTASDAAVGDGFGASLAMADGVLVVGAPFRDAGGREAGAAYVFVLTQDGGVRQAQVLTGDGGAGALFGHAVATDGVTAAASARRETAPGDDAGAVYVYRRAGDGFVREQRLEVPALGGPGEAAAGDELGTGLALDGDRLAAGARFDDAGAPDAGAVWTFRRNADGWAPEAVLRAAEPGAGDELGYAVALSGERLVAGAYRDDDAGPDAGTACPVEVGLPASDLSVAVACQSAAGGGPVGWTVRVRNGGTVAVPEPGALVTIPVPAALSAATATCSGPSPCTLSGATFTSRVLLDAGGTAVYTLTASPVAGFTGRVRHSASVAPPAGFDDPNPGNDRAGCTTCVGCADLTVGLSCPQTVVPGLPASWTATVTNNAAGPLPAPGAAVSLTLPPGVAPPSFTCTPSTAAGSPCTLSGTTFTSTATGTVSYVVSGLVSPGTTGNLAPTVTAAVPPSLTDLSPGDDAAACPIATTPRADLAVTHAGPPSPAQVAGDRVTFRLRVTNDGPSTATAVVLTASTEPGDPQVRLDAGPDACEPLPEDPSRVACDLGTLAPGGVIELPLTYRLDRGCPPAFDAVTQRAEVVTEVEEENVVNNVSEETLALPFVDCPADLRLTKSGPATATAGGPLAYSVTASNAGAADVSGARVVDDLPPGLLAVSWTCTPAGGAKCAPEGAGDLDEEVSLPAGSSVTYGISGSLDPGLCGEVVNSASVAPPEGVDDVVPADNFDQVTTLVFPGAGVCAVKELPGGPLAAEGQLVSYRVLVLNGGPGAVSDGVGPEFRDVLPGGVTLTGAGADSGTVSTAGNTVTWSGAIPADDALEILIDVTVDQGTLGQTICNQGEVLSPFVLTDDPAEPGAEDPTCFTVVAIIPTLAPWILALLALLLAAAGALVLRRRRTTG